MAQVLLKLLLVAVEVLLIDALIAFFEAYRYSRNRTLEAIRVRAGRNGHHG